VRDFFRPNLWPNTPDILTDVLQQGGPPAFALRFLLAATLAGSYGIYGPAFEQTEATPREPGSEEYLNSEKYEIRHWDLEQQPDRLRDLIRRVNVIRRHHPALQQDGGLRFHGVDNPSLLCYSRHRPEDGHASAERTVIDSDEGAEGLLLIVVTLDPYWKQGGFVHLDMAALGLAGDATFQVHDLLTDERYWWHGPRNYVELDPHEKVGHVFRIRSV
jgi:starch synthase (maltosyl-transferring)